MKMIFRVIQSALSSLSVTLVFWAGFLVIGRLAEICDERVIVWERRSALTRIAHLAVLEHEWQWGVCLPVLAVGFFWLAWQAEESAFEFWARLLMSSLFVAIMACAFPLLAGCALHEPPNFKLANLAVPLLSCVPLVAAACRHLQRSRAIRE